MRKLLIAALLLATALLCFEPAYARDVEVTFWHSLGYHVRQVIDEMTEEFNRNHPGIRVKAVYQGYFEDVQVKMLAAAVSRQLPDLAHVPLEYLQVYVDNGLIEPIDKAVPDRDREDILPVAWDAVSRDGNIYGVPFCFTTDVLLYNQNAFKDAGLSADRPPETWDQLVQYGKQLTRDLDGDGSPEEYGLMFYLNGFYGLAPLLWANGGTLIENGKVDLTSPPMRKTLGMVRDLVFEHGIMPRQWTPWESGQAFLSGDLAMGWITSAAISFAEQNLPWELQVAHMPSINGRRFTMMGGSALVNFSGNRRRREAAQTFALWCASEENMLRLLEKIGFVPVRRSALDSLQMRAFLKKNPNYRIAVEALDYARLLPRHPEYYMINREINQMLERVVLEGADPAQQLRITQEKINQALDR
jgi:sn-glycerol 3-phosphate transport system substrate-binding protein